MRSMLMMLVVVLLVGLVACSEEDHEAAYQKGDAAYEAGDYAMALELWAPAAEAGHTEAQVGVGFLYDAGSGVEQDKDTAEYWFRRAVVKKSAQAAFNLGHLLIESSIKPNPFNEGRAAEGVMYMYLAKQRGSKQAVVFFESIEGIPRKILDVALEAATEHYPDEF